MLKTIGDMRVGDVLTFGQYSVHPDCPPSEISWLKADDDCSFISEFVVDYLAFDAPEENYHGGNPNYVTSNLLAFLNSEDTEWYHPAHPLDCAPGGASRVVGMAAYGDRPGFLHDFEPYELEAILPVNYAITLDSGEWTMSSRVRLPSAEDIIGIYAKPLKLFRKKGKRATPTRDLFNVKRGYMHTDGITSFVGYWLRDQNGRYVERFTRNSCLEDMFPLSGCGVRPMLNLNPSLEVFESDTYFGYVLSASKKESASDQDIYQLLGLAQP